jgi:hypothetical protein
MYWAQSYSHVLPSHGSVPAHCIIFHVAPAVPMHTGQMQASTHISQLLSAQIKATWPPPPSSPLLSSESERASITAFSSAAGTTAQWTGMGCCSTTSSQCSWAVQLSGTARQMQHRAAISPTQIVSQHLMRVPDACSCIAAQ